MALSIRIGAVPGVLTTLELPEGATVADALAATHRTLGPRQHIEMLGAEGVVATDSPLTDDRTYAIIGSATGIDVDVVVGSSAPVRVSLDADAASIAHALHAAGVDAAGRSLTLDGQPASCTDFVTDGQVVGVGADHLLVRLELAGYGFTGTVALPLGSTPIEALLAAGVDCEVAGFLARVPGGADFAPLDSDAALIDGSVLRLAPPAGSTPAAMASQTIATQTIYGLTQDNGDGSASMCWFRDRAVVDMLLDSNHPNWDEAFNLNEGPAQTLTFPADLDLAACGFSFSDDDHPLPPL